MLRITSKLTCSAAALLFFPPLEGGGRIITNSCVKVLFCCAALLYYNIISHFTALQVLICKTNIASEASNIVLHDSIVVQDCSAIV